MATTARDAGFTLLVRLDASAIDDRQAGRQVKAAVYDAKAAVQFVRAKAAEFDIDPDRIGLIGDSAGAHLSALVALAGDQFTSAYRDDAHAAVSSNVKAVVGFYGVYDLLAQWTHDLSSRPRDPIVEKFLGTAPTLNRRIYFEASPISYATVDRNQLRAFLGEQQRGRAPDAAAGAGDDDGFAFEAAHMFLPDVSAGVCLPRYGISNTISNADVA